MTGPSRQSRQLVRAGERLQVLDREIPIHCEKLQPTPAMLADGRESLASAACDVTSAAASIRPDKLRERSPFANAVTKCPPP
jgi:hypothetical protein